MHRYIIFGFALFLGLVASVASAADPLPTEQDYYPLYQFQIPEGIAMEGGGVQLMPDGKIAVSTRRGEIWMVENAFSEDPTQAKFTLWASGLHEVLGISEKNGSIIACQRCELTKVTDTDKDGRADLFETISDGWEINGDYHEYAFGSKPDKEGNTWIVLCLTGSFSSEVKYRGWCVRVTPEGKLIPTCSGIRSPGGIGPNAVGDMFYTDNQGPWNGTCELKFLKPGTFQGHPDGNKWYKESAALAAMGKQPESPKSGSRFHVEAKRIPEYNPPVIMFPYGEMGQSASGIACDTTGGKFGPFKDQLFVGDQTHSTVMRVYLEKVKGHYQGACFPFRSGISSGSLAVEMTPSGSLFVGSTSRGWGSRGTKPYGLDRIAWSGKVPFEVLEMKARPDGFELVFTEPVDPATAGNIESYKAKAYTYIYQAAYGSPKVDEGPLKVTEAKVSADNKSVVLKFEKLQEGSIHELHLDGVKSAAGLPLLHKQAYYTLMYVPDP